MTDERAREIVKAMKEDKTILDDLPDPGWVSIKVSDLEQHIAQALREARAQGMEEAAELVFKEADDSSSNGSPSTAFLFRAVGVMLRNLAAAIRQAGQGKEE